MRELGGGALHGLNSSRTDSRWERLRTRGKHTNYAVQLSHPAKLRHSSFPRCPPPKQIEAPAVPASAAELDTHGASVAFRRPIRRNCYAALFAQSAVPSMRLNARCSASPKYFVPDLIGSVQNAWFGEVKTLSATIRKNT